MALTKVQQNELMVSLLEGGLNRGDCAFQQLKDGIAVRLVPTYAIRHEPTRSIFTFSGPQAETWTGSIRVGTDPPVMLIPGVSWRGLLDRVQKWATDVADWESTPDLWALDAEPLPEVTDNTPFTADEQADIAKYLDYVKDYVRENFELRDYQLTAIAEAVEYLKEESKTSGRKQWRFLFYGTFMSYALEHSLDPAVLEAIYRLAVAGLGHLFGAGGPPMIVA
jgi:hypothetical protein